jgi:hypothetical protein
MDHDSNLDEYRVHDYDSGSPLEGNASPGLVAASLAAGATGAISAYLDGDTWRPLDPSREADYRRMGERVATVYAVALATDRRDLDRVAAEYRAACARMDRCAT